MPSIPNFVSPFPVNGSGRLMEVNPFTLTFTGSCRALEEPFLETYTRSSLSQVRLALLFGFIFYALFGFLDALMAMTLKYQFWYIRFGIVCPSILLALLFTFSPHFVRYMQATIAGLILIAGGGIVYMTAVGNVLLVRTYYVGLMLVLMVGYTFIRARFIWATLSGGCLLIAYIITASFSSVLPRILLINNAFFCISANVLGMLICYSLEYYARCVFIWQLRDEQHKQVETAKTELEKIVQKRTAMLAKANEELWREIQANQRLDWEKKALENQLLQAQKMEAIGTLAGGIAHDFNNILAAIIGHTELALMQQNRPRQIRICLVEVLNASQRAKELVGQILAFSRHSGSELKPMQISSVIKEALRLLRASLPPTIAIKQHIAAAESIVVADATQIHQIMMNLCTNAAHAMDQGGTLLVTLSDLDICLDDLHNFKNFTSQLGPGKYVCLSVADTGHGISSQLLERIFDPYFTTKAKGVGTGLGLAVVRGIVQNHGGIIDVKSRPNRGTTFSVYLPRVENQHIPKIQHLELLPPGNEQILFVDDDISLAQLGSKLLATLGYQVVSYHSPQAALDEFRKRADEFDLVITDMIMPGISGEVLARQILKIRPGMPVIIYTGYSDGVDPEKLQKIGVKVVLHKPITIYGLAQAIRQALKEGIVDASYPNSCPPPKIAALPPKESDFES